MTQSGPRNWSLRSELKCELEKRFVKTLLSIGGCIIAFLFCSIAFAATEAEKLVQARQAEFEKDIIDVAAGVYTAVGYGVSTTSMIVGDSGVVIIDAQIDQIAAKAVLAEFRKISDKPVEAIIFTHAHGDLLGARLSNFRNPVFYSSNSGSLFFI